MKTELYVLVTLGITDNLINIVGRGTRREVCELLLTRTPDMFWTEGSVERARKAIDDNQLDVFEVIAGNCLALHWKIQKLDLDVEDPALKKLRAEIRQLKKTIKAGKRPARR